MGSEMCIRDRPVGMPNDPEGDLLGFTITYESRVMKLQNTAKKALDTAIRWSGDS